MTVNGIDVSHWQGTIDWNKVAAAGCDFAFIKATENNNFLDSQYARNWASARAVGLEQGAYHFAKPDGASAVKQADYFASVVGNATAELPPMLDLEDAGGLGKTALRAWVQAFMTEADAKFGRKIGLYVGPSFYANKLGSAWTWPADTGHILWIAHWGVTKPTVPANNWQGQGWTFWQYTSSGSVNGISGRVDLDHFNGTLDQLRALAGGMMSLNIVDETYRNITVHAGAVVYDLDGTKLANQPSIPDPFDRTCLYIVTVPGDTTHTFYAARLPGGAPGPELFLVRKADVDDHGPIAQDCTAEVAAAVAPLNQKIADQQAVIDKIPQTVATAITEDRKKARVAVVYS